MHVLHCGLIYCKPAHAPQAVLPVVPLVDKPAGQRLQVEASITGRASGAMVSLGQAKMAVPSQ